MLFLPVNSKVTVDGADKQIALVGNTGAIATVVPFFTKELGLNTTATNFYFLALIQTILYLRTLHLVMVQRLHSLLEPYFTFKQKWLLQQKRRYERYLMHRMQR